MSEQNTTEVSGTLTPVVRCEVLVSHCRTINGTLFMLEPMFSGIMALPDDEDTRKSLAAGFLRLSPNVRAVRTAVPLRDSGTHQPLVGDHAFVPSRHCPDGEGCAAIIEGDTWTVSDPIRCRRPEREHAHTWRAMTDDDGHAVPLANTTADRTGGPTT